MEKGKVSVVKILIKDHHDRVDDLVSRPLVRSLKKINTNGINQIIDENGIYLYCILENGELYETFTQRKLEIDNIDYQEISSADLVNVVKLLNEKDIGMLHSLICKYVFGDKIKIDFVEETMEERASDRAILFQEYNNDVSLINPYEKEHENDYNLSLIERYNIEKQIKSNYKSGTK